MRNAGRLEKRVRSVFIAILLLVSAASFYRAHVHKLSFLAGLSHSATDEDFMSAVRSGSAYSSIFEFARRVENKIFVFESIGLLCFGSAIILVRGREDPA